MNLFLHLALFFVALCSSRSQAQLSAVSMKDQMGTLPKGRFIVSYVNSRTALDSFFSATGTRGTLSDRFSNAVSWNTVIESDPARANQLQGLLQANQVDTNGSTGQLDGAIQGSVFAQVPVIGYGITDQIMVVFTLPIVRFQVASDYAFRPSESFKQFSNQLVSGYNNGVAAEFEYSFQRSFEILLANNGFQYRPLTDKTMVGDLRADFLFVPANQTGPVRFSLSPHIIFPTAQSADPTDLYQFTAGNGRAGLGGKVMGEWSTGTGLAFSGNLGGSFIFSGTQMRRIPRAPNNPIDSDVDTNAIVSGGHQIAGGLQTKYEFPVWVSLFGGIQLQKQFQQEISGSVFEPFRYVYAAPETDQSLTHIYAGMELNSIKPFLAGNFLLPAAGMFSMGYPLTGTNVPAEPTFNFQGSLFF